MTDIEQKALALVNAVRRREGNPFECISDTRWYDLRPALEASIEAHEADKARLAAEMREQAERFSEAVKRALNIGTHGAGAPLDSTMAYAHLAPFILHAPDPLVEAREHAKKRAVVVANIHEFPTGEELRLMKDAASFAVDEFEKALEARGLAIVKKEAVNG